MTKWKKMQKELVDKLKDLGNKNRLRDKLKNGKILMMI